jgi:hypothetical protein
MHPYSFAMASLVAEEAMATAQRARPRITDYVPQLALNQVRSWLDLRRRLLLARTPAKPQTARMAAASRERCRAHRQHCWAVADAGLGRDLCRCSGRMPAASAWNARRAASAA